MKREERLRLIEENMGMFGPLPDDYEEFVEQSVFKLDNIIIYSKKDNKAYCTGCKQDTNNLKLFKKELVHNKTAICPCCGRVSVTKSKGYIKNGFEVTRWSMIVQAHEEDVLVRYINHLRKYNSDGTYIQTTTELLRSVITSVKTYEFGNYWDGWSFYRNLFGPYGRGEHYEPQSNVMLYNTDIDTDLKDTICKYSAVSIMVKHNESKMQEDSLFTDEHIRQRGPYNIENYLRKYVKYPYCEQLIKLNCFNLLKEVVDGYYKSVFKPGKKRIHETLGLTRSEYLQLRTIYDPTSTDIEILLKLREKGLHVTNETYYQLHDSRNQNCGLTVDNLYSAMQYMSEQKALKMCQTHGTRYIDYLDMANKLGWDMRSTMVLFPKDFNQAHEIAVEQFNKQKQAHIKASLKHIVQSRIYDYEDNDLCIVVPQSGAQIVKEGHRLHHCVARYVDDVAKGKTMILFVRKKENPKKPFYTLEWKDNKVIQCYGYKDCKTTEDVENFIRSFEKNMLEHKQVV